MRKIAPFITVLVLLSACGGRTVRNGAVQEERAFPPMPSPPSVITDRQAINEYLVTHYWDAFLDGTFPCDSTHVNGVLSDDVEKALEKYLSLIETGTDLPVAQDAVSRFFDKLEAFGTVHGESNVFPFFRETVTKYLYDPNSPLRDEDLYHPFVSKLAKSSLVPDEMKPGYSHDASMCFLNRAGSPAADISFTDLAGRKHTLYGIKAWHTLLFFSNPECKACKEIIVTLEGSQVIRNMSGDGRLAVVNVYIDKDIDRWKSYAAEYPSSWHSGYDQDYAVRSEVTYNVRAIPSLYLLDSEKKVIMKDAPAERIIRYLENKK